MSAPKSYHPPHILIIAMSPTQTITMLSTSIHTFSLTALFNRWFKSVSLPVERSTEKYTLESPREGQPKASDAAPLDPSLFKLAEGDMDFLHDTVTSDDNELRSRIFAIQKKS